MSFEIPCPNCGWRELHEFKFGGEVKTAPRPGADLRAWREYIFMNDNLAGISEEWWYHTLGCGQWFKVKRDTVTNRIVED